MMNKDNYPMYAIALVAGAGITVWAGLPITFLFLLICPVMMFFMMRGMGAGQSSGDATGHKDAAKRADAAKPDGSHERIDQP